MSQTKIEDHFSPRRSTRTRRKAPPPLRVVNVDTDTDSDGAIDRVKVAKRKQVPFIELATLSARDRSLYSPLARPTLSRAAIKSAPVVIEVGSESPPPPPPPSVPAAPVSAKRQPQSKPHTAPPRQPQSQPRTAPPRQSQTQPRSAPLHRPQTQPRSAPPRPKSTRRTSPTLSSASPSPSRSPTPPKRRRKVVVAPSSDSSSGTDSSKGPALQKTARRPSPRRAKRAPIADPDSSEEDMVADIELDEADRFKTNTRLRKKSETAFQRSIRKAREARLGIIADDTESDESESDSSSGSSSSSRSSNFIEEDGGLEDGMLPHEFSRNATQSPEYKFKVVFHYLLLLVMRGPSLLPLKGDTREYFDPMLQDLRRRMKGLREQRVRSQIWRTEFVRALETYPDFTTTILDSAEAGCDACHISTRWSTFQVILDGDAYDRDTHEPKDNDSSDSDSEDEERFVMGKYCHRRARAFHALCHWENELYDKIQCYYHDLLRAMNKPVPDDSEDSDDEIRARTAARVRRLQSTKLPRSVDIDQVLIWMDARGYQKREYQWLEGLEEQARLVEHDNSKDE